MKKIALTLFTLLIALASAVPASAAKGSKPVKFTEVVNYFHNNNAPLTKSPLITTQADFDSQFSPAARMGKDGMPTQLDFRHQAVVAIVLPETSKAAEIRDVSLVSTGKNKLTLTYTAHYGSRQSYTVQPIYLMAIDGKYRKYSISVKANIEEDPEIITTNYGHTQFINNPRHMDISIDYPTAGNLNMRSSVMDYEADLLAHAAESISYTMTSKPTPYTGDKTDFGKMLTFYTTLMADSMNAVDRENNAPDRPCGASMAIIRVDENANYVTYRANGYLYMGGAHGLSVDNGATFNKATNRRAVIVKGSDALVKLISTKLPAEVKDYIDTIAMPQIPAFLRDGKVVFLYQTGEIAANAAGAITVEFWPYEIQNFLTDEGAKLTQVK